MICVMNCYCQQDKLAGALMKVAVPFTKNILAPLGITAAASVFDVGIQNKIHGSGTVTLVSSNEEINNRMELAQALENSNILLKGVTKKINNLDRSVLSMILKKLTDLSSIKT